MGIRPAGIDDGGVAGSGQRELLEAIAGLQPVESGSICYIEDDGTQEELLGKDPLAIADKGITLSFVPEDRLGMGLVGNMDLSDNMMLRSYRKGRSVFTDRKAPKQLAEQIMDQLQDVGLSYLTLSRAAGTLSGGTVRISFGHDASDTQTAQFLQIMRKLS